jgi:hypothetical protein
MLIRLLVFTIENCRKPLSSSDQRADRFPCECPRQVARREPVYDADVCGQLCPRQKLKNDRFDWQRPDLHLEEIGRGNLSNELGTRVSSSNTTFRK